MRKSLKYILWVFLLVFILNAGLSVYFLTYDLKTRFPELNLKIARFGVASWYSKTDKGINERTANNEKFNDKADTCASWDYPFDTKLLVINVLNGKWVVCRVNDRGPAKRLNREVDLTKGAFKKISNLKHGLILITFTPVKKEK